MYTRRRDLNIDQADLVELTDSAAAPLAVDEVLLAELQEKADRFVDAFCGKYVTPFARPPQIVIECAIAVWRWKVYGHRPKMPCPDTVRRDYEDAMKTLREIRDGQQILDAPAKASSQPPQTTAAGGLLPNKPRLFGRGQDGL